MIHKLFLWALRSFFGAFLLISQLASGEIENPSIIADAQRTATLPFEVTSGMEMAADFPPVHRVTIKSSAGKISFLLDSGYRIHGLASEHVIFAGENYDRSVKFRMIDGLRSSTNQLQLAPFRTLLAHEYPGASVVFESTLQAGGKTSPVFDLEWMILGGVRQSARVLYVPCGSSFTEIGFTANTAQFEQNLKDLNKLLLTICTASSKEELVTHQLSSRL